MRDSDPVPDGHIMVLSGLVLGRILSRYKRFLADVEQADGSVITVHCTNTGTMKTCWEPGDKVLLRESNNPGRKLPNTWIACRRGDAWIGVDTSLPNRIVAEAVRRDALPGLFGLTFVRTEAPYGAERSRIDVLAKDGSGRLVYLEVKNTTLRLGDSACFPDAVTARGSKHLRELAGVVREGNRAAIVFFVHRDDVACFDVARQIDPGYAAELDRAAGEGVEVVPLSTRITVRECPNGTYRAVWELTGVLPWARAVC